MRVAALLAAAILAAAVPSAAIACSSYTGCREQPAPGTNPSYSQTSSLIETVSQHRQAASDGPSVATIYQGTSKVTATLPCLFYKALIYVESSWTHFCGDTGRTIVPTSCGFGYSQITWGMKASHTFETSYDRARVASSPIYNLSTGLSFLADNWNMKPYFAGRDPEVLEHWYFVAWRYNNYVWSNNPNNPNWASDRGYLNCPNGSTSAARYPYPERVWGFMRCPVKQGGSELWTGAPVTYPDASELCNTDGCTPSTANPYSNPLPNHEDPCQKAQSGVPYDSTTDTDGDGQIDAFDCAPRDPACHLGAAEICDGKDNDCNGTVDVGASCAGGKICSGGRCVECLRDTDCDGGKVCQSNACIDPSVPPECLGDADCGQGQVCSGGRCVAGTASGCATDADCGAGRVCIAEACVEKDPSSSCATDTDCAEGEVCDEGYCRSDPVIGPDDGAVAELQVVAEGCGCGHSQGMAVGWPLALLGLALSFGAGRRPGKTR